MPRFDLQPPDWQPFRQLLAPLAALGAIGGFLAGGVNFVIPALLLPVALLLLVYVAFSLKFPSPLRQAQVTPLVDEDGLEVTTQPDASYWREMDLLNYITKIWDGESPAKNHWEDPAQHPSKSAYNTDLWRLHLRNPALQAGIASIGKQSTVWLTSKFDLPTARKRLFDAGFLHSIYSSPDQAYADSHR